MKILITTGVYPPEIGGPATYTALMEKEIPKHGTEVSVLPFRVVRHLPRWIRHFVFFWKVVTLGKKADVLYAQDPLSVGFPTMAASKFLRKPFVVRIAGDYAWEQAVQRFGVTDTIDDFQKKRYGFKTELMRFIQKTTARNAVRVINPSKYFRDLVAAWAPGKIDAVAIYNGIDFPDSAESGEKEPMTIISAGRLLPWKGFDTLIRMMQKLSGWKLYIAGDGEELQNLKDLARVQSVSDKVIFLGNLDRNNLLQKIKNSEIFILNTSFESFSFQVVEAMHCRTPVITTNIGNLPEIIDDGREGILIQPNDEAALIAAIDKLHKETEFRNTIVTNAANKAMQFSINTTVELTLSLMKEVIEK